MAEHAGWDHKKGGFSDEAWDEFADEVFTGDEDEYDYMSEVECNYEDGWCCDDMECWYF